MRRQAAAPTGATHDGHAAALTATSRGHATARIATSGERRKHSAVERPIAHAARTRPTRQVHECRSPFAFAR